MACKPCVKATSWPRDRPNWPSRWYILQCILQKSKQDRVKSGAIGWIHRLLDVQVNYSISFHFLYKNIVLGHAIFQLCTFNVEWTYTDSWSCRCIRVVTHQTTVPKVPCLISRSDTSCYFCCCVTMFRLRFYWFGAKTIICHEMLALPLQCYFNYYT